LVEGIAANRDIQQIVGLNGKGRKGNVLQTVYSFLKVEKVAVNALGILTVSGAAAQEKKREQGQHSDQKERAGSKAEIHERKIKLFAIQLTTSSS
jgi:hypothetical protein